MASRNRIKQYVDDAYYHIYNRGVNKCVIFNDQDDYAFFLNLLKRYLDNQPAHDKLGREYEWLHQKAELLAFCLMPNHYHLLLYVHDSSAMTRLIRGVATAYSSYFNKKYQRVGPLFQDRFNASWIINDSYLEHISRYIHLNPRNWRDWEFSSLPYYLGKKTAGWLQPQRLMENFTSESYLKFVADYTDNKRMLDEIKAELADR